MKRTRSLSEVNPRVDANRLVRVLGHDGLHSQALLDCHSDQIREIVLLLRQAERYATDVLPKPAGREAVHPRVQFSDRQLLRCGDRLLDDLAHGAVLGPYHTPEAPRIVVSQDQDRNRARITLLPLDQPAQCLCGEERHIRVRNKHQIALS